LSADRPQIRRLLIGDPQADRAVRNVPNVQAAMRFAGTVEGQRK